MEVHSHTHTPRKKWTHYLWEFLMLFLAVTLGFFVENQREHFVEHQREKQYIRSLVSDVKTDTANITAMLRWFNNIQKSCDTILDNFDSYTGNFTETTGRNAYNIVFGYPDFIYTDRTMQQLKNSGGMRLIRNTSATDSIISYDASVRDILLEETMISSYWKQLNDLTNKIFNYQKMNAEFKLKEAGEIEKQKINFWIKQDTGQFVHLYNLIYKYRITIKGFIDFLVQLKNRGSGLIDFLQKEYDFK